MTLTELERLAREAAQFTYHSEFAAACSPSTILRLLEVCKAAKAVNEVLDRYGRIDDEHKAGLALRSALSSLEATQGEGKELK